MPFYWRLSGFYFLYFGLLGTLVPYWSLYAINSRDSVNFRYYQTGSPFEYTLVRLVYMNYRALLVEE